MISLFLTNSIDPTRTITLRNKFVAEMHNRFASLMIDIRQAVIELDVFGLVEETRVIVNASGLSSKQYDFPRTDQKVEAFVKWLKAKNEEYFFTDGKQGLRMAFDLISSNPNSARSTWMKLYIDSAYQQGIRRARQELRKKGIEIDEGQLGGEPIVSAFNGPVHADRVGLIYTRAYSSLQGITAEMESVVSDVLAMGLADGRGPREIARLLDKAITGDGTPSDLSIIDSLGRKIPARRRAEILARTEIIRAHHSANIGEYKAAGILGINVQVEWLTAGDSRVCPKCSPMNGKLFQIDEAEYIIPAHPQCRCVALPYIPDEKEISSPIDNPGLLSRDFSSDGTDFTLNPIKQWGGNFDKPMTYENVIEYDLKRREKFIDLFLDHTKSDEVIQNLDLSKLKSYQTTVFTKQVNDMIVKFDQELYKKDKAIVFKLSDGTLLLKDGNHRVNAAKLSGLKNLDFIVIELIKDK